MFDLKVPDTIRNELTDSGFRVFVNANSNELDPVELLIMEDIGEDWLGEGVSAKSVVGFVNEHRGRDINVRINSPGGLVYDGLVIYNALTAHDAPVTVTIEGLAFSAASFIAMAGDTIRMHEASDIGIHRAWGGAVGNSKAMRGVAEWLDTIDSHLIDIYQARTGQNRSQIEEWLDGTDDGTLFAAKDAVEHGFADEVIPSKQRNAKAVAASVKATNRIAAMHNARLRSIRQRKG